MFLCSEGGCKVADTCKQMKLTSGIVCIILVSGPPVSITRGQHESYFPDVGKIYMHRTGTLQPLGTLRDQDVPCCLE